MSPSFTNTSSFGRSNKIDRSNISWQSAHQNFVKLNFDGSSRGNPDDSGAGVCIRDHLGNLKAFKSSVLPLGTNNMAEEQALLEGPILVKNWAPQNFMWKVTPMLSLMRVSIGIHLAGRLIIFWNKFGLC